MTAYYIARQPILDTQQNTFGYELLFRTTEKNAYDPSVDGDVATARLLVNTIVDAGLDTIVGNALAFVNLTQQFLENPETLDLLEPGRCVLEVLEHVEVTDAVVAGVKKLRSKGHTLALDDFVDSVRFARLLPLVDIIKYDITQHSMDELVEYRLRDSEAGRLSLAERVETVQEYHLLKDAGFDYFQGYFFARPQVISSSNIPQSKITVLHLIQRINDPSTTIQELAEVISHDVGLSVRTLRYVNSPLSELNCEITSIFHAVVLLGTEPIRNWAMLMMIAGLDDKPVELTRMALTRARFCQLLAKDRGLADHGMYFTMGLLSLLGALMGTDQDVALEKISISSDMRNQLLSGVGEGGDMLRLVAKLETATLTLAPDTGCLGEIYQRSVHWADQSIGLL